MKKDDFAEIAADPVCRRAKIAVLSNGRIIHALCAIGLAGRIVKVPIP